VFTRRLAIALLTATSTAMAAGCGGGSSAPAGVATVTPPPATATDATTTADTTPPRYRTALARKVAVAFSASYAAVQATPTASDTGTRDVLVRDPPVACARRATASYRCTVSYQGRSNPKPFTLTYAVTTRAGCLRATGVGDAPGNPLHRLSTC
jgi:hypothetical protein